MTLDYLKTKKKKEREKEFGNLAEGRIIEMGKIIMILNSSTPFLQPTSCKFKINSFNFKPEMN